VVLGLRRALRHRADRLHLHPDLWSIYLSFFEAYNTVTPSKFVGAGNYLDMLRDSAFRSSLWTFIVFAPFIVPTTFALSLLTAFLVARTKVMQTFFRSVFFLPTACSYVVAALIWKMSIFAGVPSGHGQRRHRRGRPRRHPVPVGHETAVVLAGHRHRAAVAAGRVLYDPVPRCAATDFADSV
jgi:hypothetical protein